MPSSPSSNSEARSESYGQLDPRIQRWIWESGWTELRDAQERAIPLILGGNTDVIIAASTASGKTEAAFLPILTELTREEDVTGLAIYIGPLKALINDQWQRLETLAESLDVPVTPWHGDIAGTRKTRFLRDPRGCLLITPESMEATLMRQGSSVAGLFAQLRFLVIDEVHAFLGSERGKQLQSQLHRIERCLGRRVPRIGLSATLGDMAGARAFLRPEDPDAVKLIQAADGQQELHVLVRGVLEPTKPSEPAGQDDSEEVPDLVAKMAIVDELFRVLRGTNNLVFPNSRRAVEFYADRLRRKCEEARVSNEFWPHHGNLAKEMREETEAALKQKERPATAICTNTLELGIDIGAVKSVAQIGPPPSVASLRQRLGRSGRRRGEPAILRGYAVERQLTVQSTISDQLRESLVQSVAMIRLLARGWYEPVPTDGMHASTLVQQVLSVISQYGGLKIKQIWELLCSGGPFSSITPPQLASLLRELGSKEIIFQDPTGTILLAPKGERICEHYTFYAAFSSDDEFTLVAAGRTLGSMPITRPLVPGSFVIFGGRRWEVLSVSQEDLVIEVRPASAGALPSFDGASGAFIHGRVRGEMREVLRGTEPVGFLDRSGQDFLQEAREAYHRLALDEIWCRQAGDRVQLFLWKGDRIQDTLMLLLNAHGFSGVNEGLCVSLGHTTVADVKRGLIDISVARQVDGVVLAASVQNKARQKWDSLLPPQLLNASFASDGLDVDGALETIRSVV